MNGSHREGLASLAHLSGAVPGAERARPYQLLEFFHLEHATGAAVAGVEAVRTGHADAEDPAGTEIELGFGYLVRLGGEPVLQMLRACLSFPHQLARRIECPFQHQIEVFGHHPSPFLFRVER